MRRIGNLFAGGITAGLIIAAAVVNAAPSDVRTGPDLLVYCPALEEGSGCPEAAASFLQSADPTDADIVELVVTIAEQADLPTVPKSICLDAAAGLRVLAEGTSSADRRQEIINIADALCQNSATGAIGDVNSDAGAGNNDGNGGVGSGGNGSNGESSSLVSLPSGQSSQPSSTSSSDPSADPSSFSSEPNDNCAGNSDPGNGNNCDNPNNSDHSSQSSASEQPPAGGDCAGNSTPKNGENCNNPNNS